jgi:hypothetical protein
MSPCFKPSSESVPVADRRLRRSFVRAYAQAIGLDPEAVAREFAEEFPDPAQPPSAVENAPHAPAIKMVEPPAPAPHVPAPRRSALRVKIAETGQPFTPGHLLAGSASA